MGKINIRVIKCDHMMEKSKLPAGGALCTGDTLYEFCNTCVNAVRGQVYSDEIINHLKDLYDEQSNRNDNN